VIGGVCILTRQTVILDLFQPTARRLCLFFGRNLSKTKTYFLPEQKTDTTAQLEKSSSSPRAASVFGVTRYIKPKGTCDTRNEFTRKYVQERLVYEKVRKFRLSHQKRDRGDNTVGWHDTEQYTTSMRDFWHFLP
jgi:hypothetical protein